MTRAILHAYRSRGQYRWQLKATNGRIIGASTEAYMRQAGMRRNLREVTGIDLLPFVTLRLRRNVYLRGRSYDWYWPLRGIKR